VTLRPSFLFGSLVEGGLHTLGEIGGWMGVQLRVTQCRSQGKLLVLSLPALATFSQMFLDAEVLRDV
jgi:hypothetical protein